jgi:threonine/homoserine/homoserine lactone efflux protein
MGNAIGQVLPFAVGVAVSPMPIVAVVLMLVTGRARSTSLSFVAGWVVGLAVVGTAVLAIGGSDGASQRGSPATWVSALKLVLGLLLLFVAVRRWRARPPDGGEPATPKWMGAIEDFTPVKAGAAGLVLAGVNPKNLLLTVGGAAAIAQTGVAGGEQAVALAVLVVLATVSVAAPVAVYFAMGTRAQRVLDNLKNWMAAHNAAIMAVLCLVFGAKLIGDAISGLSG